MYEEIDYKSIFSDKKCKQILDYCLKRCDDSFDTSKIKNLKINLQTIKRVENDTFIKKIENDHIWYRWRRGAKGKILSEINENIKDLELGRMHLVYIKFVKKEDEKRKPIVVGKSNSSSTFDLVYTTKVEQDSVDKMNSKKWLKENEDWMWDVEHLEILIPEITICDEDKQLTKDHKEVIYRKVAYAIESNLMQELKAKGISEIFGS